MTNPHCKQGAFDPETGSVRYICRLHCGASLASAKVDFVMIMMIMVVVVQCTPRNLNCYTVHDLRIPQREI